MRILWLKTELLHPIDKGGRIRTYGMLRELRKRHRVTYLTLDDGGAAPDAIARAQEYCHELVRVPFDPVRKSSARFYLALLANLGARLPYFLARYRSAAMRAAIDTRLNDRAIDVLVCDFLNPAVNLPARVGCGSVLFEHNVEALIWRRHYEVARGPLRRAYMREQWRKARRAERALCRRFDAVVAVSADDREMLRNEYGLSDVSDVPTGVDTEYFAPADRAQREPHHIVFTGSMDWLPNVDAMRFFLQDVLPSLRARLPDTTLTIVGRDPVPEIVQLAKAQPGVEVTGRVPDVRPYMESASAFIVPIRVGSGTRLKIYEAMAMERPVVSTTIGCEGLPVLDGQQLLVADTGEAFADALYRVLTQPELAAQLAARAAEFVRSRFSWASVTRPFEAVCERVAAAYRNAG